MVASALSEIFVVDDEPVIASTLAKILELEGYSVSFFTDPLAALVAAAADTPRLLISDVAMPQISGVQLALRISILHPSCGVLLFSGRADELDVLDEAAGTGFAFKLIAKPAHPTVIIQEVKRMMEFRAASPAASSRRQPNRPHLMQ